VLSASHNVVLIPSDDESTSGLLTRACAHEKETEEEKESETERQGEQERKRDLALVASSAAWLPLQDHCFPPLLHFLTELALASPVNSNRRGITRARELESRDNRTDTSTVIDSCLPRAFNCTRQPADGIGEWISVAVFARDLSPKPRFALGEVCESHALAPIYTARSSRSSIRLANGMVPVWPSYLVPRHVLLESHG